MEPQLPCVLYFHPYNPKTVHYIILPSSFLPLNQMSDAPIYINPERHQNQRYPEMMKEIFLVSFLYGIFQTQSVLEYLKQCPQIKRLLIS